MDYFKIVDDGYIVAIGVSNSFYGEQIDYNEYLEIDRLFSQMPIKRNSTFYLNNETLEWEEEEIEQINEGVDEELFDKFKNQIMNNIKVDDMPNIEKIGYKLEQIFIPETMTIGWEFVRDESFLGGDGSDYTTPIAWQPGQTVTKDLWYMNDGFVWFAIKTGVPSSFDDRQYFEIV